MILAALALAAPAAAAPVVAHTGEAVDVTGARAQEVADLLASFPHGDELAELKIEVVAPDEAELRCRGGLACYLPATETLVMPDATDGYAWEQVLAHEYGHHLAANRVNAPWSALDYGPKRWATLEDVCQKDREGMFVSYRRDPGEAFAEAYRLLVSARTQAWTPFPVIVDSTLFPMAANVQAAVLDDITSPWTGPREYTVTRRLAAGATAVIPVSTPLDGTLDAGLLTGSGTLKLGRASGREVSGTVCGERTTRLTLKAAKAGLFRISVSVP